MLADDDLSARRRRLAHEEGRIANGDRVTYTGPNLERVGATGTAVWVDLAGGVTVRWDHTRAKTLVPSQHLTVIEKEPDAG